MGSKLTAEHGTTACARCDRWLGWRCEHKYSRCKHRTCGQCSHTWPERCMGCGELFGTGADATIRCDYCRRTSHARCTNRPGEWVLTKEGRLCSELACPNRPAHGTAGKLICISCNSAIHTDKPRQQCATCAREWCHEPLTNWGSAGREQCDKCHSEGPRWWQPEASEAKETKESERASRRENRQRQT